MIAARILGTASVVPGRAVSTAEVVARAMPGKDPARIEAKTGIRARHWAEPGARMSDLAAEALGAAVRDAGLDVTALRRVILVTSTGGDCIGPATANAVIHALGIDDRCDGFDVVNACMGFLTGFDLAARSVATGLGPVGVVAVEMMSRFIRPEDPRPYVVFGDAAAAAVLGAAREDEGVLGFFAGNDGGNGGTVYAEQSSLTRQVEHVKFAVPNSEMGRLVVGAITRSARAVLEPCGLAIGDVDWILPHQPNGSMLDTIVEVLGVDRARVVRVVDEVGSVVAASVPTSLDRLMRTGRVAPGHRILMIGVGSGLAYGAILYQVAP